jgi:NADPH:quinone reductase-like Zn-dependent oxidoreductase
LDTNHTLTTDRVGAWSEYAVCPERFIALKPPSLSFEEAASIPLAATTAYQALKKYDGDLAGKTVFVPAGCMCPRFTLLERM